MSLVITLASRPLRIYSKSLMRENTRLHKPTNVVNSAGKVYTIHKTKTQVIIDCYNYKISMRVYLKEGQLVY